MKIPDYLILNLFLFFFLISFIILIYIHILLLYKHKHMTVLCDICNQPKKKERKKEQGRDQDTYNLI